MAAEGLGDDGPLVGEEPADPFRLGVGVERGGEVSDLIEDGGKGGLPERHGLPGGARRTVHVEEW